ncbi:MAG: hypothetical protein AAF380_00730 [Bacteroidota bacterium]
MKTNFKLLHLLSHLLLWTPNTPFASNPNPRRNLNNAGNFCYATSVLQAYADYLEEWFKSNGHLYQQPIHQKDSKLLKNQKAAYQEIRKALDYIKKKTNTKHPDLHTLLTLLNRYNPELECKKYSYNNPTDFLFALCSLFEIKEYMNFFTRQAITPPQAWKKSTLKVNTDLLRHESNILNMSPYQASREVVSTKDLACLLTYLWADALQSAYPNKPASSPPIPLVTESCIAPLYKGIATYLLQHELTNAFGLGEKIVEHLALDIDKALDEFIAANERIPIEESMKNHIREKMKEGLKACMKNVHIEEDLYKIYKHLKSLCEKNGVTDQTEVIEDFFDLLNQGDLVDRRTHYNVLEVKDINFDIEKTDYEQNELNKYCKLLAEYETNNKPTSSLKLIKQENIKRTVDVEDMHGRSFTYELTSGLFSTPNYGSHYIAFVKHSEGYRIYDSLHHNRTNQLHNVTSLTNLIVKEMNAEHSYERYTEKLSLVYEKVEKGSQVGDTTYFDQIKTNEAYQETTSLSESQSRSFDSLAPYFFALAVMGLAGFASKKYSKPKKTQALKNKKSPHPTKY